MTTTDGGKVDNHVDGVMSGVQAGVIEGGVTIQHTAGQRALKLRRATEEELQQVREYFVPPGGFDLALRRLSREEPAIVLCGRGTGRHYAATRLLVDHGVSAVVDLNRDSALDTVKPKDLTTGEGYIWDVGGTGEVSFTEWEWRHAVGLLRDAGCALVVVVDHARQVPAELSSVVTLVAPDAVEVAATAVRQRGGSVEDVVRVVKNELADLLGPGTPPSKAVWAATLAGELDPAEARTTFAKGLEEAVDVRYRNLPTVSYTMLMAVAVLENQPCDEVVRLAADLDRRIRVEELPEDKKLRPRKVFETRRDELLAEVDARVVLREHPAHDGRHEETVRFVRPGWAEPVLCRIWTQYHRLHRILLDWMGQPAMIKFSGECALALSRLIMNVPAHAPLDITNELARSAWTTKRYLAALTLAHIAGEADHRELVEKQLEGWVDKGSARQRWTAAVLYGTRYSKGNVTQAMDQLERIARKSNGGSLVRGGVASAMVSLLARTEDQDAVLPRVLAWCRTYDRSDGAQDLRATGHLIGLYVCGLTPELYDDGSVDIESLAQEYPDLVRQLARSVLRDGAMGQIAIDWLAQQGQQVELDKLVTGRKAANQRARLVRLVLLIAPDLGWWSRRKAVAVLAHWHPGKTRAIRHIFRTAVRVRKRLPGDVA